MFSIPFPSLQLWPESYDTHEWGRLWLVKEDQIKMEPLQPLPKTYEEWECRHWEE